METMMPIHMSAPSTGLALGLYADIGDNRHQNQILDPFLQGLFQCKSRLSTGN